MSARYALQGANSRDLLTWNGRVLIHDNAAELEFLVAGDVAIVPCPNSIPADQTLSIRHHPQFAAVTWPLNRQDFR